MLVLLKRPELCGIVTGSSQRWEPGSRSIVHCWQRTETTMSKRELIDTGTDKRYVRRDDEGQFKQSDDVGRSLAQDVRQHAKTKAKPGEGDRGDH